MSIAIAIAQMVAALVIIVVVLLQDANESGIGAVSGAADTFFGKNKGRTIEAKLARWTAIIAAAFIVLTVILDILVA